MSILQSSIHKTMPSRRNLRDSVRSEFFSAVGLTPQEDPYEFEPDPAKQAEYLKKLIGIAQKIHTDESSALDTMLAAVVDMQFGLPQFTLTAMGRPTLDGMNKGNMLGSHFSTGFLR